MATITLQEKEEIHYEPGQYWMDVAAGDKIYLLAEIMDQFALIDAETGASYYTLSETLQGAFANEASDFVLITKPFTVTP